MIAGIDFPSRFDRDNISERRAASPEGFGVHYDPESLLTGAECAAGLDFVNSRRDWPNPETYLEAVAGRIPFSKIPVIAPRVPLPVPLSRKGGTSLRDLEQYPRWQFIDAEGKPWIVYTMPFYGLRIWHEGFVEWPVKLGTPRNPRLKLATYSFNGDRSDPRGAVLPRPVLEYVSVTLGVPVNNPLGDFPTPATLPGGDNA